MAISRRSPADVSLAPDGLLVHRASCGDRLAFGVLYFRHHEAAWRVANAVTGFSPRSDAVVIEAFARALRSLPSRLPPDAALRPHLLAGVRAVALEEHLDRPGVNTGATMSDGREAAPRQEIAVADLEPLGAQALRQLDEPLRTALWLSDVEALTPAELSRVMGIYPEQAAALAAGARLEFRCALTGIFATSRPRSCPPEGPAAPGAGGAGGGGRSGRCGACAVCRMRSAEVADVPSTLRSAIPVEPPLGGSCQRRWLDQCRPRVRRHHLALSVVPLLGASITAGIVMARTVRRRHRRR